MKRGEKLHFFMKQKGYNKSALSKASDIPYTTIDSMIKSNLKNSSIDNVIKICRVLGIQVEDLLENNISMVKEETSNVDTRRSYHYFGVGVSAGLPIGIEPIIEAETITIPDEVLGKHAGSKNIYFMRVNGESMNKVIPHRSLIAVKQIEVENLKNGDIVVYSNGHDYAVKRFYDFGDEIVFRPESTEMCFRDFTIKKENADEIRLHGKVITYIVNLD